MHFSSSFPKTTILFLFKGSGRHCQVLNEIIECTNSSSINSYHRKVVVCGVCYAILLRHYTLASLT